MLDPSDLRLLSGWCRARAMGWSALRADSEAAVLLLEPRVALRPWQRLRLIAADAGYRLDDEAGQTLAVASDLPALLDAVDGGVADTAPLLSCLRPSRHAEAGVGLGAF